jgi:hypothetical protein
LRGFLARGDALKRHLDKPPSGCVSVTANTATADFKRRETDQVLKEFKAKLERCLMTGAKTGMPFAWIIKATFPKSWKKGSREQSRLLVRKSKSRGRR